MKVKNIVMVGIMALSTMQPLVVQADTIINEGNVQSSENSRVGEISSGTFGTSPWFINQEGVLHIGAGMFSATSGNTPWYQDRAIIKEITFDGPVLANRYSERLFQGLNQLTTINNPSNFDTSNVIDMTYLFWNCSSLTSLDVSSWDTSNVEKMTGSFLGASALTNLDLSSWDVSNVKAMNSMFGSTSLLSSLNVSTWNTSNVTNFGFMFQGTSLPLLDLSSWNMGAATNQLALFDRANKLQVLTLGTQNKFDSSSSLPEIPNDLTEYTGNWQNVGSGTLEEPEGKFIMGSRELMTNYDGATMSDTYVWQRAPEVAQDVTVKYVDQEGTEIHTPQTIRGTIGEDFDATTEVFKLTIDGYTLDENNLPTNGVGQLSDQAQEVRYVYTKDPIQAKDVTVKYVNQEGIEIHAPQTISGNIGEDFDATTEVFKLAIAGYTLDENNLPTNGVGQLSDQAQEVRYVYTKDPIQAKDVTVKYVDQEGTEIHSPQTISGTIGEDFDATTEAFKLAIVGYTLDENNLPTNGVGQLNDQTQEVRYVYTKDPIQAKDVTVKYVDQEGTEIHSSQTISGTIGEKYSAVPMEIKGYNLKKKPENATGLFTDKHQLVTFIYEKIVPTGTVLPADNLNQGIAANNSNNDKQQQASLPQNGQQDSSVVWLIAGVILVAVSALIMRKESKVK
ncbi:MucBP domain-containing protein [Carnobacterium maltaromaticum]|uniref:MucBP domain-containing protein n=1 Tax=Carnobacterium maltaromaticum TaxID=2751 RepID=UPI0039AEE359